VCAGRLTASVKKAQKHSHKNADMIINIYRLYFYKAGLRAGG
jgi:hypothetical protein